MDYHSSGVDIDAGNEAVRRIRALRAHVHARRPVRIGSSAACSTRRPRTARTGARGQRRWRRHEAEGRVPRNRHDTVGADLVNHCVNDILVQGAAPLFFLDYSRRDACRPGRRTDCERNGARVPRERVRAARRRDRGDAWLLRRRRIRSRRLHRRRVERRRVIDGRTLVPGDVLIGLPSTGLHTNGYSLARRIVFERLGLEVDSLLPESE